MMMLGDASATGGIKADCSSASPPLACSIDTVLFSPMGSGQDGTSTISVMWIRVNLLLVKSLVDEINRSREHVITLLTCCLVSPPLKFKLTPSFA